MLKRDAIIVGLSPTAVRVGVLSGGEFARVERVGLDPDQWDDHWRQNLRPIDDALREACKGLRLRPGAPARLLYLAPRTLADIFAAPATGTAAVQAAELSLLQSLPDAGHGWITGTRVLGEQDLRRVSMSDAAPGQTNAASTKRTLVLTLAERADDADILANWVRRAGLTPRSIYPSKAALLLNAMRRTRAPGEQGTRLDVQLGEHACTLVGWINDELVLGRCAEVGYALLADAMYRSGRSAAREATFSRDAASRLLFSSGIPSRGQTVDQNLGLDADHVLPLFQPALQRYMIEIRQTARFGLMESDLSRVRVRLLGTGAGVPGLAESLATHTDTNVDRVEADTRRIGGAEDDQLGDLPAAVPLLDQGVWITPPAVRAAVTARSLDRAVHAGIAGAALGLAALGAFAYVEGVRVDERNSAIAPRVKALEADAEARSRMASQSAEFASLLSIANAGLGERPHWRGVFTLLAGADRPGLVVDEISADYQTERPTLSIRCTATGKNADGKDPASAFLDELARSPLVLSARVVSARVAPDDDDARELTLGLELATLPVHPGMFADAGAEDTE